jgi:hypothetical protein
MEKREQLWANEDAERDAYRKKYSDVSPETLSVILEIWAHEDRLRLRHRVITRKGDLSRPKPKPKAPPKVTNREREDEQIKVRHEKQDFILSEKWKYEDVKRIAKRKAQEHLIYLKRCEDSAKLAERRKEEDERHGLAREDGLGCASRLGTAT